MDIQKLMADYPLLREMQAGREVVWLNPGRTDTASAVRDCPYTMADIEDAEARLHRFAPFIRRAFPETESSGGIIESALTPVPRMQRRLAERTGTALPGRLFVKRDSDLPIAGSVKARGGIYEVLKHTEELALEAGLLHPGDDYARLAEPVCRDFFAGYTIQVGSTGNLGLSIGIMSAAIGYRAVVHMSADAKQWKKDLLRSHGVTVVEYADDYSAAVREGRRQSDADPRSYFVDDENSVSLFLGYAVAALRLKNQLREQGVAVDGEHPLFVYLPCGVGGAPGGVSFGIKQVFGDAAHCFFVEPVQAPCMLAGLLTGLNNQICVQDIGLTGQTHADGLAVGRPSGFIGGVIRPFLDGALTVADARLYDYMRDLLDTEGIFLEPSACAAFQGPARFASPEMAQLVEDCGLADKLENAAHIAWATGGRLVPAKEREVYKNTYL